jgi:4-diphosphocytidyl-2-C-methyl-D-erythritol kinase
MVGRGRVFILGGTCRSRERFECSDSVSGMILTSADEGVRVLAPAKLNLFLEVLERRADGFHEIETLMVAVTVFDTIEFVATHDGLIRLACERPQGVEARARARGAGANLLGEIPEGADNLVVRAVERLRTEAGVGAGARIRLIKRIPSAAGLGGASSDAAAALAAANVAWRLGWPWEKLTQLGGSLGSDVPFFFGPGAAICRGRGERLEPWQTLARMPVVVIRPPEGLSTAEVYRHCAPAERPVPIAPVAQALRRGHWADVGRHLHNRLEPAAARLTDWIERLQSVFHRLDCLGHQMSGSGSSYFGICRNAGHARRMAARLRSEGLGHVAVATTLATPRPTA